VSGPLRPSFYPASGRFEFIDKHLVHNLDSVSPSRSLPWVRRHTAVPGSGPRRLTSQSSLMQNTLVTGYPAVDHGSHPHTLTPGLILSDPCPGCGSSHKMRLGLHNFILRRSMITFVKRKAWQHFPSQIRYKMHSITYSTAPGKMRLPVMHGITSFWT
jgi:hypothetical protein